MARVLGRRVLFGRQSGGLGRGWLVSPPRPDRIADRLHHEIIRTLWPEVLQIPLSQKTSPKMRLPKLAERAFFAVNRF